MIENSPSLGRLVLELGVYLGTLTFATSIGRPQRPRTFTLMAGAGPA
jgi:hypothetical protein